MMASIVLARGGADVALVEKNEKFGKKLYITGKGRCNLTNDCELDDMFANVVHGEKFLRSSLYGFTPQDTMAFFEDSGLKLVVERGNRVFPFSQKSSDVIKTLQIEIANLKVKTYLGTEVKEIKKNADGFKVVTPWECIECDKVVVATGGMSYPSTGSTGDGYAFAKSFGHTVTSILPSLISLETEEDWPKELMGLSLKNITLTAYNKRKKQVYSELGEMLFTHFGVSGPLVLSASSRIADDPAGAKLVLDLKPALSMEELDKRLVRDFQQNSRKSFCNALDGLFPKKLIPVMVRLSGIAANTQTNSVTREQRCDFAYLIKNLTMHVKAAMPIDQAIITRGGINVKEINPSTMESKLVRGLYFAGEVMDVDAYTGGFNIQIACSTGVLAGRSIE